MSNLYLNQPQLSRWIEANGDYTHSLNYNLNENSTIMDLGGYTGVWAQQMIGIYNCNVFIVEPLKETYNILLERFQNNLKVKALNVGVATENKEGTIYLSGDGSSSNVQNENGVKVEFRTINHILDEWGLAEVDLLQINIEGDEYPVVAHMIETGIISKFRNIQVQFHLGIENAVEKRKHICEGLKEKGFRVKYSYPFVWEAWTKE